MTSTSYRTINKGHTVMCVGAHALMQLPVFVRKGNYTSATVITDTEVGTLHGAACRTLLKGILPVHMIALPPGERTKDWEHGQQVLTRLFAQGIDRQGVLVALGGGVVGDLTGFIASVYKRGIDYIQVPTSLIALTDSAIGGKTGIDFAGSKNSVGTFYQPRAVIGDPQYLLTLPRRELINGMAEVIKHGLIGDKTFHNFISSHTLDTMPWERVIQFCTEYKARLVARDERDTTGTRAKLNLGHTVGHAVEALSDYRIPHGHGVAIGMMAAARISSTLLGLGKEECGKIEKILQKFELPTQLPAGIDIRSIMKKLGTDKKTENGKVKWVLLKRIGSAVSGVVVPLPIIKKSLEEIR